ncbi:dihydrodipicolinate synthase family protein [Govanella unica]|uniref:Dihydrodipicolinate synthase family protein n=1 Tax=Govanella unica TaxID=2975056 RepID=A0A9X3TYP1_9PROT|nr:dihydrodipicolinate synthase family protein [Govania unica]MDA5194216.1 dihydrodipicolinate synthase family protein [Govania unica]
MDRNSVDWRGYMPAITTTFTRDGDYDARGHAELLEWLYAEGMHGIVALGTTGEWFSLQPTEKAAVFQNIAATLKGKIPLIAGCTGYTASEVGANMAAAAEAGFDGVLITPPPYICLSDAEILEFYREAAKQTKLPICIYNWPPGTNIDLSLPLIEKLIEIDNVVALKHSTSRLDHFSKVFFAIRDRVRVFGFNMDELGLTLLAHQGGDGTMGAGAVLGRDHPNFYNEIWNGNLEAARECGARDRVILTEWYTEHLTARFGSPQAILKEAFNVMGLPGGYPRRPILPLQDSEREIVRATLEKLGKI